MTRRNATERRWAVPGPLAALREGRAAIICMRGEYTAAVFEAARRR